MLLRSIGARAPGADEDSKEAVELGIILLPVIFLFPVAVAGGLLLAAAALASGSSGRQGLEEDNDGFEEFPRETSDGDRETGER